MLAGADIIIPAVHVRIGVGIVVARRAAGRGNQVGIVLVGLHRFASRLGVGAFRFASAATPATSTTARILFFTLVTRRFAGSWRFIGRFHRRIFLVAGRSRFKLDEVGFLGGEGLLARLVTCRRGIVPFSIAIASATSSATPARAALFPAFGFGSRFPCGWLALGKGFVRGDVARFGDWLQFFRGWFFALAMTRFVITVAAARSSAISLARALSLAGLLLVAGVLTIAGTLPIARALSFAGAVPSAGAWLFRGLIGRVGACHFDRRGRRDRGRRLGRRSGQSQIAGNTAPVGRRFWCRTRALTFRARALSRRSRFWRRWFGGAWSNFGANVRGQTAPVVGLVVVGHGFRAGKKARSGSAARATASNAILFSKI